MEHEVFSVQRGTISGLISILSAGCNANIVWQNQPKRQVDMVKDAFWDYVATATMTAEDSLKQIRQSQLGKDVKYESHNYKDTFTRRKFRLLKISNLKDF